MSKNAFINRYIVEATRTIEESDIESAKNYVREVIPVFKEEIPNIDMNLDYTNINITRKDYINDVRIIKSHLENYKVNLKSGIASYKKDDRSINVHTNVETKIETNIVLECELVIKNISQLSDDIISKEEKEQLEEKIASLQLELSKSKKDKSKISEKLMNLLKFTVTKGPEVFVAISNFLKFVSDEIMPLFRS